MDNESLNKVNQQIYSQFPYLQGIAPAIKPVSDALYELHYQGSVQTANGNSLPIFVKVVADDQGNIKKLVNSR